MQRNTTPEWRREAACADPSVNPDLFYPSTDRYEQGPASQWEPIISVQAATRQAKEICRRCPVKDECLQDALEREEAFGIRGGLTPQERNRLSQVALRRRF